MNIKVLGPGCANCKKLEANTLQAVKNMGIEATVTKISDIAVMMSYGIMSTPALVVNEKVVSFGRLLQPQDIEVLLKQHI